MAHGDTVTIEDQGYEGYLIQIRLSRYDPNSVRGAIGALLADRQEDIAPPQGESGTLEYVTDQQGEVSPDNVVPFRTPNAGLEGQAAEPASPEVYEREYRNLERLNSFVWEGRVRQSDSWQPFTLEHWQEGVRQWCPHIEQKEAEFQLSEYIAAQRIDDNDDSDFE